MASINSVGSKNLTSSLYNSANVISGLASGLDTEGMIEGLVDSYNQKIQSLTNKATKVEWKQESYRNIIAKMYAFSNKYASYTSSTNLLSPSFFNNAVNVTTKGNDDYLSKISASGRTDSDIVIKRVSQLAAAARYVTGSNLAGSANGRHITASEEVDLTKDVTVGTLQGTLSLNYGNKTISIAFDDMEDQVKGSTAAERAKNFAALIEKKLGDEKITLSNGETVKASDRIGVNVGGGRITFTDKGKAGNEVYISNASGTVGEELGLDREDLTDEKNRVDSITVRASTMFTREVSASLLLSGKSMNINLDGTSRSITLPTVVQFDKDRYQVKGADGSFKNVNGSELADTFAEALNKTLEKSFGGKVSVKNVGEGGKMKLEFTAPEGSDMLINSDVGGVMGIGKSASNYMSTSKKLGELLEKDEEGNLKGLKKNYDGTYNFVINGVNIGSYDENTTLSQILSDINTNKEAGVKVTYSNTTRQFSFTAKETGVEGKVELGEGLASAMFGPKPVQVDASQKTKDFLGWGDDKSLQGSTFSVEFENGKKASFAFNSDTGTIQQFLDKIGSKVGGGAKASITEDGRLVIQDADGKTFGVKSYGEDDTVGQALASKLEEAKGYTFTEGKDAKFLVEVNGSVKEMVRGSNTTTIDGLTVTLKGTFDDTDGEGVSFQRSVDSDKIVDAVKSMITDYNEMMGEIRKAYATLPQKSSNGAFKSYEPLTDEDKASMSESAIQAYEEKAKQGLLFGDSNLSTLYSRLRNAFGTGSFSKELHQMGITVSYDGTDGSSFLALDESKLREKLESDPDGVMEAFTSEKGVMQEMKTHLDRYGSIVGSTKGILVEQAGTPLSSSSLMSNAWQKQIDGIASEVEKWQSKLSDRVDYYTSMFSRLEVLINQMNSQSSSLAGMLGG